MSNYYFLAPSLPPLVLGEKPDITFDELRSSLEINLTKADLEKAKVFGLWIDLHNIRSLFLEEAIDPRGNLNEKELDEALLLHDSLPDYVFSFLDQFQSTQDKVKHFWGLISQFFSKEAERHKGFLRAYFTFEKQWRLVSLALKAKTLKRDLLKELQFEDFSDPLVAHISAQKDAPDYDPPPEYQELKALLLACGSDPWKQNIAQIEWRFQKIEESVERPLFSIDWILAYIARFLRVEQLNELDPAKGKAILNTWKVIV